MKTQNAGRAWLYFLLGSSLAVFAQSPDRPTRQPDEIPWISQRLQLGARIHYYNLKDTRRSGPTGVRNNNIRINFIGSLWGLDEIQDYVPRFFIQYAFVPYFGIGATYDHIAAKTLDTPVEIKNYSQGDGDVEVWGPMLYLFARYPNSTRFTPFAEVGWAYYYAHFDESAEWASVGPGYRFEVDDTEGYFLAAGLDFTLNDHWHAQAYWRRLYDAKVDARAYFSTGSRVGRAGAFPMECQMLALGMSYEF